MLKHTDMHTSNNPRNIRYNQHVAHLGSQHLDIHSVSHRQHVLHAIKPILADLRNVQQSCSSSRVSKQELHHKLWHTILLVSIQLNECTIWLRGGDLEGARVSEDLVSFAMKRNKYIIFPPCPHARNGPQELHPGHHLGVGEVRLRLGRLFNPCT
jgi:hypothetical protein